MNKKIKGMAYIVLTLVFTYLFSMCTYAARLDDEIEVYRIGNSSITIKWTPYDSSGLPIDKYIIGYRVHNSGGAYTPIEVLPNSLAYDQLNNEFRKVIGSLSTGTIYDIKIDTYVNSDPDPITFYKDITVMTKIVMDKSITDITYPYTNDNVGHLDFAFYAPNDANGSVDEANIDGYNLIVSSTEGQIYSNGQPYKALYDGSKYKLHKVTGVDTPLKYNNGADDFTFNSQVRNGKDLLTFPLYKSNQPTTDNFNLGKIYYVMVQPIFKSGSLYEDVIFDATARYESIENISTLLPLTVIQASNDLINLEFPSVGTGSMSYDIYRGRLPNSLSKIHTEYDDGSRLLIQYYNKIDDPVAGDVYYFKVMVSGQNTNVRSKTTPLVISLNPNVAPIIENLKVEAVIEDTVDNFADIIISFDKPKNEDDNKDDLIYGVYLNTDQINQVEDSDVVQDGNGNIVLDGTGKIILNTKKDINNNNILFKGYPVVYERVAEIYPADLNGSNAVYTGNNPLSNYLTTGDNYYRIIRDDEEVIRIIYKIKGKNFLANTDVPVYDADNSGTAEPHVIYMSEMDGALPTDYKTKIELNTAYFVKMDSYNSAVDTDGDGDADGERADYSLPVSFTTQSDTVDTVPTPEGFGIDKIETQEIGLVWDKLNEEMFDPDSVRYEVFISENGSYADTSFFRIKTPAITLLDDKMHLDIDVDYTLDDDAPKQLQSNTVYLFRVRAVYSTKDNAGRDIDIYSNLSEIFPVTTKRIDVSDPDVNAPPAPIDFILTAVTSKVADFSWTKVDDTSTYRIVRTAQPIDPFATLAETGNGVVAGFTLNGNTYTYSDASLAANNLYYFSIRAETVFFDDTLVSPWITIPVTTILVESPTDLALVSRSADGHSIKIKFKGKASLNYEAAKKDDSMANYQIAETAFGDINDPSTKFFEITLQNLKSNTQYLIKVRARDTLSNTYSKYTEPIQVRTEFNQTDYDTDEENKDKQEIVTELGGDWLKNPIDIIGANSTRFEIWAKYQKASDAVKNSPNSYFTIDLSNSGTAVNKAVYIPIDLIYTLNRNKVNLEIKTKEGKFYIKPWLLDPEVLNDLFSSTNNTLIKSKVVRIQINELNASEASYVIPSGSYPASKATDVSFKLVGYTKTETELDTAIIAKVNEVINTHKGQVQGRTIEQIKETLDSSLKAEIKNAIDSSYIMESPITLQNGKLKIVYNFTLDPTGKSNSYTVAIRNGNTAEEIKGEIIEKGKIQFETPFAGRFVVIGKNGANDIIDHEYQDSLKILTSKYDFSKEFANGKFRPDANTEKEEAISFVINILNPKGKEFEQLNNLEKAKKLGLTEGLSVWDLDAFITREELAHMLAKIYEIKTGINPSIMKPTKTITITDIQSINTKYRQNVYWTIDNGLMKNDEGTLFYPTRKVTRGETAEILVKLLKMMGEIK